MKIRKYVQHELSQEHRPETRQQLATLHDTQEEIRREEAVELHRRYGAAFLGNITPRWYHTKGMNWGDTTKPLPITGLLDPTDGSDAQHITITTRGIQIAPYIVSILKPRDDYDESYGMFKVTEHGVEPPECTELAKFIIDQIEGATES